jgi:hypothetical protein
MFFFDLRRLITILTIMGGTAYASSIDFNIDRMYRDLETVGQQVIRIVTNNAQFKEAMQIIRNIGKK